MILAAERIATSANAGAKLRIFTIASTDGSIEEEELSMATLLAKFRIDFSDVRVIPDIDKEPTQER